jgi:hypothetical protein
VTGVVGKGTATRTAAVTRPDVSAPVGAEGAVEPFGVPDAVGGAMTLAAESEEAGGTAGGLVAAVVPVAAVAAVVAVAGAGG